MTARIYTALAVERAALRGTPAGSASVRVGMGRRRAVRQATLLRRRHARAPDSEPPGAVLVTGFAGGLAPGILPGDVVVANEVRVHGGPGDLAGTAGGGGNAVARTSSAPLLAGALRRLGLRVHVGPVLSSHRLAHGAQRRALAATGALAVDMESAWLAVPGMPFAVARVVVDTNNHPLWSPGIVARGSLGLRTLRRMAPVLAQWADATGPREVIITDPRTAVPQPCDLVLVVGSVVGPVTGSGLLEPAGRAAVPTHHIDEIAQVDLRWFVGARTVCVVAAGCDAVVGDLVRCLNGLGSVGVSRRGAAHVGWALEEVS